MEYNTAARLVGDLRARRISSVELTEAAIRRIEALDGRLNSVVARDFERARIAAKAADAAIGRGESGALLGLPMTVKEAFNVAGLPTTWGLPGTQNMPVQEDAVVVQRLKAAGAVILGKTNIPTMLADWQCANPVYGATRNPWDHERTPGGSSGGGAAALAAGFVALEYGSDLSASLRAPAHFCGVYAHKPSFGLTPSRGFAPPGASSLSAVPPIDMSVLGPMARSAEDLALALACTAGPDLRDAVGYRLSLPAPRRERLADYRVLILDQHPLTPTAASIRGAIDALADRLSAAGCQVGRESPLLPNLADITILYVELLLSIFSADAPDEAYTQARAAADALSADAHPLAAAAVRGPSLSHRDWVRADRRRAVIAHQWSQLFEAWDVVICPSMSTNALPLNPPAGGDGLIMVDGAPMPYQAQPTWAMPASLTGQPATVVPIGRDADGLPIGVQIMGGFLEDRTTIAFAACLAQAFGGFVAPPAYASV